VRPEDGLRALVGPPAPGMPCGCPRLLRPLVVFVCGGDGTWNWVVGALEGLRLGDDGAGCCPGFPQDPDCAWSRVVLVPIPLGTGNDASGSLGWGRSWPGTSTLLRYVEATLHARGTQVVPAPSPPPSYCSSSSSSSGEEEAEQMGWRGGTWESSSPHSGGSSPTSHLERNYVRMDTWRVGLSKGCFDDGGPHEGGVGRRQQQLTMCNYFSVGVDGEASRRFNKSRSRRSSILARAATPFGNKAAYAALGGSLIFKGAHSLEKRLLSVEIDGQAVELPAKTKAVLVLNLPSYADGTAPWPIAEAPALQRSGFRPGAIDDGCVEVVALLSLLAVPTMKLMRSGGGFVKSLGQGSRVALHFAPEPPSHRKKTVLSTQVDGEPFRFESVGERIEIGPSLGVNTCFGPSRGSLFQGPPAQSARVS